jgi:hypothetical protein
VDRRGGTPPDGTEACAIAGQPRRCEPPDVLWKAATVPFFATSNFVNSMFLIMLVTPVILLWAAAVVDVIRRGLTGWTIVGWLLLILALPLLGPLIYFALRKPSADEAEQSYLAQREVDRVRAARPTGGLGMGP